MIPVSCFLEVILDNVQYSRDTKLSISLVLLGVAVCTVTDVSVNTKGFIAAAVAVWSTSLQQYVSNILLTVYQRWILIGRLQLIKNELFIYLFISACYRFKTDKNGKPACRSKFSLVFIMDFRYIFWVELCNLSQIIPILTLFYLGVMIQNFWADVLLLLFCAVCAFSSEEIFSWVV